MRKQEGKDKKTNNERYYILEAIPKRTDMNSHFDYGKTSLEHLLSHKTPGYYYDRGFVHGYKELEISEGWLSMLSSDQQKAFESGKKDGEEKLKSKNTNP